MSISGSLVRRMNEKGVEQRRQAKASRKTLNGSETAMRFMVIVKANKDSEAGVLPDKKILEAMGKFNDELVKAGVMLAGEGLQASSKGERVKFSGKERVVGDGPFTETKEMIGGYAIFNVPSKKEALEWTQRFLEAHIGLWEQDLEVEVRQMMDDPSAGC